MVSLRAPLVPVAGLVSACASVLAQLFVARRVRPRLAFLTGLLVGVGLPIALRALPPRWTVGWITVGGRRSGWIGYGPLAGPRHERNRDATPESPQPLLELRDLVGVVPIGRTERAEGATLTLLSLERYEDGFLVRGNVFWNEEPETREAVWHIERVEVVATDDLGTQYHGRSYGGGGGAASWRFDHAFSPTADPAAAEIRLTIPALLSYRATNDERTDVGPWTFVVPLARSGVDPIDPASFPAPSAVDGARRPAWTASSSSAAG